MALNKPNQRHRSPSDGIVSHRFYLTAAVVIALCYAGPVYSASTCPKVAPQSGIEVVSVRPVPGNQWVVRYLARTGASGKSKPQEVVVNQNTNLSPAIGKLSWQSCQAASSKPQAISAPKTEFEQFTDLLKVIGPTDTIARPLTSKPSTWGEKAAEATIARSAKKEPAAAPQVIQVPGLSQSLSHGVADMFVIAVQNVEPDSTLQKYGLLKRDLVIGLDHITFKSEADANAKILELEGGSSSVVNIVRQGRYLNLTR